MALETLGPAFERADEELAARVIDIIQRQGARSNEAEPGKGALVVCETAAECVITVLSVMAAALKCAGDSAALDLVGVADARLPALVASRSASVAALWASYCVHGEQWQREEFRQP